jgi:hypothetical protein
MTSVKGRTAVELDIGVCASRLVARRSFASRSACRFASEFAAHALCHGRTK